MMSILLGQFDITEILHITLELNNFISGDTVTVMTAMLEKTIAVFLYNILYAR